MISFFAETELTELPLAVNSVVAVAGVGVGVGGRGGSKGVVARPGPEAALVAALALEGGWLSAIASAAFLLRVEGAVVKQGGTA